MLSAMNPYETLGVSRSASEQEIKRAYRLLALQHHPDRNPPDRKAAADKMFKQISEANAILVDPERKRQWDLMHPIIISVTPKKPKKEKSEKQQETRGKQWQQQNDIDRQQFEKQQEYQNEPIPSAFKPSFSNPENGNSPQNASFWSAPPSEQPTITVTVTLEQLFCSTPKVILVTRTTYATPTTTNTPSQLLHTAEYVPIETKHKVTVPIHALKHNDGSIITIPGAGDEIPPHTMTATETFTKSKKSQTMPTTRPSRAYKDLKVLLKVQPHETLSRVPGTSDLTGRVTITKRQAENGCADVFVLGVDRRLLKVSTVGVGDDVLQDGDSYVLVNEGWVKEGGGRGDLKLMVKVLPGLDDGLDDAVHADGGSEGKLGSNSTEMATENISMPGSASGKRKRDQQVDSEVKRYVQDAADNQTLTNEPVRKRSKSSAAKLFPVGDLIIELPASANIINGPKEAAAKKPSASMTSKRENRDQIHTRGSTPEAVSFLANHDVKQETTIPEIQPIQNKSRSNVKINPGIHCPSTLSKLPTNAKGTPQLETPKPKKPTTPTPLVWEDDFDNFLVRASEQKMKPKFVAAVKVSKNANSSNSSKSGLSGIEDPFVID